jgi:hypothetical protein
MVYAFFWVIPQCLNFICRRFGTLCLFHLHRPMKMEQTEHSKMLAYKIRTLGNHPKGRLQHSECGESLKSRKLNGSLLHEISILCYWEVTSFEKNLYFTGGCKWMHIFSEFFCTVWIKFSKGNIHKYLLGKSSFTQNSVTESVPVLPTWIARFGWHSVLRHLRVIPFSIYWCRDNWYREGFAFLVSNNKITVTHVPCNCMIFWKSPPHQCHHMFLWTFVVSLLVVAIA